MNRKTFACAAAVGLLLTAGCGDETASAPNVPATGPAPTTAAPAADVAACVVGEWRSTGLSPAPDAGTADADLTGGAGFQVTIGATGDTTLIFDGMRPVAFSARLGGAEVSGEFSYTNVPLKDYTGDGATRTGDAVDIDPFFDNGTYTCGDGTLTVTPDDDGDLPIVLERL